MSNPWGCDELAVSVDTMFDFVDVRMARGAAVAPDASTREGSDEGRRAASIRGLGEWDRKIQRCERSRESK